MNQDYLYRIQNTITYLEQLKELETKREKLIQAFQKNMECCNHEILITFDEKVDERVFGTFQKYYCLLCKKIVKHYLRSSNINNIKQALVINFEDKLPDYLKVRDVLSLIQEKLEEYLTENKEGTKEDIENYLHSINLKEFESKVKKI